MASAHLLELQGNLLFSHSSETAEGTQLSRAWLKRNYCWRRHALHISNKLEAREGTEVTDVSASEDSVLHNDTQVLSRAS